MDGFLIIDKSASWTSHDVVAKLRGLTGIRKIGHAGTLDPFATGVLLVAVGQATKLLEFMSGFSKTYETTFHLGATSTTDDRTGEVEEREEAAAPPREQIDEAAAQFTGAFEQVPPQYSAVKIEGQKMYERARRGQTTKATARRVTVHSLEVVDYDYPRLRANLSVSSGTYIRALARDLGEALGTSGYVEELRRTSVGPFTLDESASLDDLTPESWDEHLLPLDRGVAHLPHLAVSQTDASRLRAGQRLGIPSVSKEGQGGPVVVIDEAGTVVGIAERDIENSVLRPRKIILPE